MKCPFLSKYILLLLGCILIKSSGRKTEASSTCMVFVTLMSSPSSSTMIIK